MYKEKQNLDEFCLTIFRLVGRNNAHIMMRNIFKTNIMDNLATNFSWTGKKNKKPFKDLEVSKLMIPVCIFYNDITESDFADYAFKWLAQASVRV
ncbi:hypothetical protein PUN28_003605 [Cardiocondyla obscurior]|uniref:DUF4806 domain-containing protein n=1 Tax=Cardiocondyla obscurior TaxID=286306 RepID=A0AAW2GJP5_9HYME